MIEDGIKISELGSATSVNNEDLIPIVQNDINNLNQIINNAFNGKIPILTINSDFQIGYSLVYDLFLEEGNYIIVPMTMGYCMQKNEKIKSYYYSLRDKNGHPLQIQKTVIPRFLDDVFYLNDPFGKNYLEYNVINSIAKNILDNKSMKKKVNSNKAINMNHSADKEKKFNQDELNSIKKLLELILDIRSKSDSAFIDEDIEALKN